MENTRHVPQYKNGGGSLADWVCGADSLNRTHPVDKKTRTPLAFTDIYGNIGSGVNLI